MGRDQTRPARRAVTEDNAQLRTCGRLCLPPREQRGPGGRSRETGRAERGRQARPQPQCRSKAAAPPVSRASEAERSCKAREHRMAVPQVQSAKPGGKATQRRTRCRGERSVHAKWHQRGQNGENGSEHRLKIADQTPNFAVACSRPERDGGRRPRPERADAPRSWISVSRRLRAKQLRGGVRSSDSWVQKRTSQRSLLAPGGATALKQRDTERPGRRGDGAQRHGRRPRARSRSWQATGGWQRRRAPRVSQNCEAHQDAKLSTPLQRGEAGGAAGAGHR